MSNLGSSSLTRREFLKFMGVNAIALSLSGFNTRQIKAFLEWPTLSYADLPNLIGAILESVPVIDIDQSGHLTLWDKQRIYLGKTPLVRTLWNIENCHIGDRLRYDVPWGIVLHWYGDKEQFDRSIAGYLRGFDSLRPVSNYITRTSAHFLVGPGIPTSRTDQSGAQIGILQMQAPDSDGTPFVASHLQPLDYPLDGEKPQYFVRGLYQLYYAESTVHSLLQDLYDGPKVDPNMRTIAIEITGHDFDKSTHFPSIQQVANVVAIVWAVMKRYRIRATNILGHHEIQLGKPDPGKAFMALIRHLIGVKALLENDPSMLQLVFGQFQKPEDEPTQAVLRYFKFVRDFLVITGLPYQVYHWEALSKYWFIVDRIKDIKGETYPMQGFFSPLGDKKMHLGSEFLKPDNHEGIDIFVSQAARRMDPTVVRSCANGICLYHGKGRGTHYKQIAIFRHRQPDGAEVVSMIGNLNKSSEIQIGRYYPEGYSLGEIDCQATSTVDFTHFAVAYGATWETDLCHNPSVPPEVGATWIRQRFLDPLNYLNEFGLANSRINNSHYRFE